MNFLVLPPPRYKVRLIKYFRFRPEDYDDYEVELPDGSRAPFAIPAPLPNLWAGAVRTRA